MEAFDVRFRRRAADVTRVRAGAGALALLGDDLVASFPSRPAFVVSDSNVGPLHGSAVVADLRRRGLTAELLTFPAGERSKTRETKSALEDRLVELGAGRESVFVAVGGGVTGDLAGFLAATWHRGVPVVQVPTTLLSMVDAALGGKTAVDLPAGKNLVGAFHQPWGVYADVETLRTLPDAVYRDGLAEIVKGAAIADAALFRDLEANGDRLLEHRTEVVERTVARCLAIKARFVVRDERESGRRAALNFGHTVAHAVEAATRWTVTHGTAVSVGLVIESRLAVGRTGFSARAASRVVRLLDALRSETAWPAGADVGEVVAATRRDKKNRAGQVRCALPARIGAMPSGDDVTAAVPEDALLEAIEEHRLVSSRRD